MPAALTRPQPGGTTSSSWGFTAPPWVGAQALLIRPGATYPETASGLTSPLSGNRPMTQSPWPWGRLETGMTLSGHSRWFPLPPSPQQVQVIAAVSSSLGTQARPVGNPGKASFPLRSWLGGMAGPPLQETVYAVRSPESVCVAPGGIRLPLCASWEARTPIPTPDLLQKPRLPWPKSREVWALSGILTSSWFWNSGGLKSRIPSGRGSRTLTGTRLGPGIQNFHLSSWNLLGGHQSTWVRLGHSGAGVDGSILPQRHRHQAGPSQAQPPVECDPWFPSARPLPCLLAAAGPALLRLRS